MYNLETEVKIQIKLHATAHKFVTACKTSLPNVQKFLDMGKTNMWASKQIYVLVPAYEKNKRLGRFLKKKKHNYSDK